MKRKILFVPAVILSILMLAGCTGKEPNEIAYAVALGIDTAENGNYKITIQYANPTAISGGDESGGKEGNIVENLTLEAPAVYSAIGIANRIESKIFSLSHIKLVVFSRSLSEKGLRDITDLFMRNEELRPDIYLAVADNSAEEYLKSVNPVMEINPAKYYQLIFDKNKLIGVPEATQENFFFGTETGDFDSLLPIAGVNSGELGEAPVNSEKFEYKMRDYTAGENAVNESRDSDTMGSAVFKSDKLVGVLGSVETDIYRLLDSDYAYSYLTIYNDNTPDIPVTVKTTQKKSPKYDIDIKNKKITVSLFLEGDVFSSGYGYNIEEDLDSFEQNSEAYIGKACRDFIKYIYDNYESDIFRLNERAKMQFLTNDEYDRYKNSVNYKEFEFEVNVDFDVRRTGLVIREK